MRPINDLCTVGVGGKLHTTPTCTSVKIDMLLICYLCSVAGNSIYLHVRSLLPNCFANKNAAEKMAALMRLHYIMDELLI